MLPGRRWLARQVAGACQRQHTVVGCVGVTEPLGLPPLAEQEPFPTRPKLPASAARGPPRPLVVGWQVPSAANDVTCPIAQLTSDHNVTVGWLQPSPIGLPHEHALHERVSLAPP